MKIAHLYLGSVATIGDWGTLISSTSSAVTKLLWLAKLLQSVTKIYSGTLCKTINALQFSALYFCNWPKF